MAVSNCLIGLVVRISPQLLGIGLGHAGQAHHNQLPISVQHEGGIIIYRISKVMEKQMIKLRI